MPQKLNGKPIDFTRTRYAEQIREGIFDGETIYALLEHHAGRWTVRDFVIGPTDVHYAGWPDEFGVPYTLLDLPQPEG